MVKMMFFFSKIATAIRVVGGRKSVEQGLAESLTERNQYLKELFTSKILKMREKKKGDQPDDDKAGNLVGDVLEQDGYQWVDKVGVSFKEGIKNIQRGDRGFNFLRGGDSVLINSPYFDTFPFLEILSD